MNSYTTIKRFFDSGFSLILDGTIASGKSTMINKLLSNLPFHDNVEIIQDIISPELGDYVVKRFSLRDSPLTLQTLIRVAARDDSIRLLVIDDASAYLTTQVRDALLTYLKSGKQFILSKHTGIAFSIEHPRIYEVTLERNKVI